MRELKNAIERAVLFTERNYLDTEDFSCLFGSEAGDRRKTLKDLERDYILEVLRQVNFNKKKASEILGIPLRTLYRRLESYGIK
ncbi:MAG: helix-turn-helix domain-containing protein [Aquificota bacterium]|nr:helix-turn-helix domain-containing protein [Aquificota bacterium]